MTEKAPKSFKKPDRTCYQTQHDIVIPAGTILRSTGDNKFAAEVGIGLVTVHSEFSVDVSKANGDISGVLKRVIAS